MQKRYSIEVWIKSIGLTNKKNNSLNKKLTEEYKFLKEGDVLSDEFMSKLTPEQQDSCHSLNRRTQFRVLRTTYIPKKDN